ncbi:MAG: two-component system, NtrC family, sensor kinase [Candidatus Binatota bacterium]|jgi:signal transduction histidine kinase|nr:two-component system, NtrC family, sensor kinase [Candidatus Binatota bacterium]
MTAERVRPRTRILLVEDSPTQAQQLAFHLEARGFRVDTAGDAERGFERLRSGAFDLLVTDLNLPGESGFDLCRRVKSTPEVAGTPVVVLTSDVDPVNVLRGLEAGADGFMTKDRPPSEILSRIQRTLAVTDRAFGSTEGPSPVLFLGQEFQLAAGPRQLMNVLLSAFEDVIELNNLYRESESSLRDLNRQLTRTNDALTEANDVKDKFLRIAAHDLRNPLGVIRAFAQALTQHELGPLNDDQDDALRRIVRQSDMMLALLSDLLGVSALRAGKLEIRPLLQDPVDVLREAFNAPVLAAREKGIRMHWEVPEALPPAEFDFNRILEVLSNLLSNAIKFCSQGQSVHLGAGENGSYLDIWVRDTGPGVAAHELPHLFEPFAKLSAQPTAGEKSTGLGLSIAKDIVDLHGGEIWADSVLGGGTTFSIRLPLRQLAE